MNYRLMLYVIGQILRVESMLMLSAFAVSLIYGEPSGNSLLFTVIFLGVLGMILAFNKPKSKVIYPKEGLIVVSMSWILMAVFGAIPFYISGYIPSFIDALFETISGFTTTGASILTSVEDLPRGLLYWRSLTHWIGGMGVLVFVLTLMSNSTGHNLHLLRAEVPGPSVEKLVPKLKQTAKLLYGIYFFITMVQILILIGLGMPVFDSIVNAFGTAGTGGFAIKNASIGYYEPVYQWVIAIFMMIFGMNFNIFYFLIMKNLRAVSQNEEFRAYIGILAVSIGLITWNIYPVYQSLGTSLRNAAFQVGSVISTTGFATVDYNQWPELSRMILSILMFTGACAGSTAGGFKISRIVILFKTIKREITRIIHPDAYCIIKSDGKILEEKVIAGTGIYLMLYLAVFVISVLLISLDGFDSETTFTAVAACFNNIGPGFGVVGPAGNYSSLSDFSKIVLSVNMLMGRLEIFPLIVLITPSAWRRI